jgi:hypothetical protein
MDGISTIARRRANRSIGPSASANSNDYDQPSRSGQINYRAWKMAHDKKLRDKKVTIVERKGKIISKIKPTFTKLGRSRVVDVAVILGIAAKLSSFVYSRQTCLIPTASMTSVDFQSDTDEGMKSISDLWSLPEWAKNWAERKMPFYSPLFYYRREDDDNTVHFNSYFDDDGDIFSDSTTKIRFRGMFLRYDIDDKEQLNKHGYAVVDDVVYYADEYSDKTQSALRSYDFQLNLPDLAEPIDEYYPTFEFRSNEESHLHYITDDGLDSYYAFDDDNQRGTEGMGLHQDNQDRRNRGHDSQDQDILDEENRGDDEYVSGEESDITSGIYERDLEREQGVCTPPEFYRKYQPTCNEMHASLSGYHWLIGEDLYSRRWTKRRYSSPDKSHLSKYLSHGYYRDAFLFRQSFVSYARRSAEWDEAVFKTMQHLYKSEENASSDDEINELGLGYDPTDKYTFLHYIEDMRKDAMVMELLSSSPRAIDIYCHCAMSSVTEFAPTDMEEYIMPTAGYTPKSILRGSKQDDVSERPLNDHISPEEKLEIALEMAKCVAVLHGYKDGPIVHVDIKVDQFFRGRDGYIKMIDYNRAEALLYDEENEDYCKWTNGRPADVNVSQPWQKLQNDVFD